MAAQGFAVPVTNHAGCTNYAQGGARVTNPVGPGNKNLGEANAVLGQLTVPIVTQVANHLAASGGSFSGKELVTVMAGGNDIFINFAVFGGSVQAGMPATAAATAAVTAMGTAGAELAAYVKSQILAKGAKSVLVVNLPDVSKTPFGVSLESAAPTVINTMVQAFNSQLQAGLAGTTAVVVDAYTASREQFANPAQFGVSNSTTPACNLAAAANPLASSLVCSAANVIAGDVSRYYFADSVHPTPYGYKLLAQLVSRSMAQAGWL
jgi:phospholipase/lecithinase/hemolysin